MKNLWLMCLFSDLSTATGEPRAQQATCSGDEEEVERRFQREFLKNQSIGTHTAGMSGCFCGSCVFTWR